MTTMKDIAMAMQRVETVLLRRPEAGLQDDAPATARWQGGMRVESSHANGTRMSTDMPTELGGSGDRVTPGWMFRAGLASCAATRIAMSAAAEGIELAALEVVATSRSDARGLLGMANAAGEPVSAGPCDLRLHVHIAAQGVSPQRLRDLVEASHGCSPISSAVLGATAVALQIDVLDADADAR